MLINYKDGDFHLHNYYKWYYNPEIKFKIREYTYRRESAVKEYKSNYAVRMLKIHSVQHLDIYLKPKVLNWYEHKWNLYYSLAEYETGIPHQLLDLKKRDNTWWRSNHVNHIIGYDFFLDIDAPTHFEIDKAKDVCISVVEKLQKNNIPFDVRFSGCGFHVIIPYSYFKHHGWKFDTFDENSIYRNYNNIALKLKDEFSDMIDVLHDSRRIVKCPYSLALYDFGIFVCMPLTIEKLINFKLDDCKPKEVLRCLKRKKN